jgi:hypothetical protein
MSHRGMPVHTSIIRTDIGVVHLCSARVLLPSYAYITMNVHHCGEFDALTVVRQMTVSSASSQLEVVSLTWRAHDLVVPAR